MGSVDVLVDVDLPKPTPGPRDLLVEVRAISVNPVDAKIRSGNGPGGPGGNVKVLGWDAAGIVAAVGTEVTCFTPGDEVYYAGSLDRDGCYSEFQVVDERIVGRKPTRIGFAEAAALPLTTLTAWEMLFDRLAISVGEPAPTRSLLVVGGWRRWLNRHPTCPAHNRANGHFDCLSARNASLVAQDGGSACGRSSTTDR